MKSALGSMRSTSEQYRKRERVERVDLNTFGL